METIDIEKSEHLLSIKQVADIKGKSPDTIRRWIKDEQIKAKKYNTKYGKQWGIKKSDIVPAEQIIEVVPVKQELQVQEVLKVIRDGIREVEEERNEEIKQLREEIRQLNKKIELSNRSIIDKIKGFFNKEG